jgi:EpsI family protein
MAIIIIGGIFGNVLRYTDKMPDRVADFSNIPDSNDGYFGVEHEIDSFATNILQADVTTLREYSAMDRSLYQLFIAYFNSQKYGSQIHSPIHCLPGGGWRIDDIQPFRIILDERTSKLANRLIISVDSHKAVMFYWYETRSGSIKGEYGLKLDLIKNALLFRPTDAAIIRLIVDAGDNDIRKATEKGIQFLRNFYPFIKKSLPF